MHRLWIRITLALLACSLAGCSLLYSYNNIDRYIRWTLDDYITWESPQENQLRSRLTAQLEWHKETQLPRYRNWLEATDRMLDNDVDVAQLSAAADQLELFWQDTAAHLETDIRTQLTLLSDEQVRDMIAVMRDKQADLESEYQEMTLADLIKKRKREMKKTIKYWLGTLDPEQIALIDTWAEQMPDGRTHWLNNRRQWTDTFERALQRRTDPESFAADIHVLFVTPEENWPPASRELTQRNREAALRLLADVHNLRTLRQREAERKRVAQWQAHLDKLATY
jgi:hypothetical protein